MLIGMLKVWLRSTRGMCCNIFLNALWFLCVVMRRYFFKWLICSTTVDIIASRSRDRLWAIFLRIVYKSLDLSNVVIIMGCCLRRVLVKNRGKLWHSLHISRRWKLSAVYTFLCYVHKVLHWIHILILVEE